MAVISYPFVGFQTLGPHLVSGDALNNFFGSPIVSRQTGVVATASGTQATAYQISAAITEVDTVATAADAVALPNTKNISTVVIYNNGANAMQVFGNYAEAATINGVATATGISQPAGTVATYFTTSPGKWVSDAGTGGALSSLVIPPVSVGSSLTLTPTSFGKAVLLNTAAGSTATLPAATGSGGVFYFKVTATTTSNAHKILAASSSDFLNGNAVGHTAAGATLAFSSAAATNHSIQMPFTGSQPSGGFIGDWFTFTDVAANLWQVEGMYQAGTTATTPFSSATS